MQPAMLFPCPHCGASFQLTPEYLAQYGGQTTSCSQCRQTFVLPAAAGAAPAPHAAPWQQQPAGQSAAGYPASGQSAPVIAYAAPAYGQPGEMVPAWSQGDLLVVRKGTRLPYTCVRCGGPADGQPLGKMYYWHAPLIYLTIFAGLLVYVIVALIVREKGAVQFSLCKPCKARRRMGIVIGLLGLFGSVAVFVAAGMLEEPYLVPLGILVLLAGVIFGSMRTRVLSPKKIDAQFLWLRGAGPNFLQTLAPVDAYAQAQGASHYR